MELQNFTKAKAANLDSYRGQFKAAVLGHIQESLGADEWERLRSMAANRTRFVDRNEVADLEATPEKLLDTALSEDGISVEKMVSSFGSTAVELGHVEGQPVYYVDGQGVYFWGLEPLSPMTLMFWITHPAYPPNW